MAGGQFVVVLEQEQAEELVRLAREGMEHMALMKLIQLLVGQKRVYAPPPAEREKP